MAWLTNEDAALWYQLQGIRVYDGNSGANGRPVRVRYRSPEDEVAKYQPPIILIEMPVISMAHEREHRGWLKLPYAPTDQTAYNPKTGESSAITPWWPSSVTSYDQDQSPYQAEYPIPYWIDYQITVYTRIAREHLYPIMAALEQESYLGRMAVLNIPQDGTFRRIIRMAGPHRDYLKDSNGKRLFRATYMIRVPTELWGTIYDMRDGGAYGYATDVNLALNYGNSPIDLSEYYTDHDLSAEDVAEAIGVHSTRAAVSWNSQQR